MQPAFQIRRTTAILSLLVATLGGGLVAVIATDQAAVSHPPVFVTAKAASVDPGSMITFSPVVKQAMPAVVNISSTKVIRAGAQRGQGGSPFDDPMFRQFFGDFGGRFGVPKDRRESGLGSGVIVNSEGYILTNNHVVNGATSVKVSLGDRREFTAKIVGTDPQSDIAVVKIDAKNLPVLPLSDSSKAQVGDVCLAIGNPFGIGQTVTMGIVSATGRGNLGIEQYEDFIQTDASINPGNSGGALINTRGELLGINTAILSGNGGGNQGIGFAVPINLARNVMDQIMKTGKVTRGYIGAGVQDVDANLARAFNLPSSTGVAITQVEPNGPGAKAGLRAGDVVTELDGTPVADMNSFKLRIAGFAPGTSVRMKAIRDGRPVDLNVKLAQRPADKNRGEELGDGETHASGALQGVSVETLTPQTARQLGVPARVEGVIVTDVDESSPAAEAGLRRGDVIQQVNRKPVTSVTEFEQQVRQAGSKSTLLLVNRNGGTLFVAVESK